MGLLRDVFIQCDVHLFWASGQSDILRQNAFAASDKESHNDFGDHIESDTNFEGIHFRFVSFKISRGHVLSVTMLV